MDYALLAHSLGIPVLGICFGHEIIATGFGVQITHLAVGIEAGFHLVELTDAGVQDRLFRGIPQKFEAILGHGYEISHLPEGATHLVQGRTCHIQSFRVGASTWGVQFHPDFGREEITGMVERHGHELLEHGITSVALEKDERQNKRVLANFLDFVREIDR